VTGDLVFDSGDAFEQLTASLYPSAFNCSNSGIARDGRSPTKRPEPEGVVLGKVAGRMLAFVGLERIGGIVVHDVSDPFAPRLLDYLNTRIFTTSSDLGTAGDLGPEGLLFIRADPRPSAAHPPARVPPSGGQGKRGSGSREKVCCVRRRGLFCGPCLEPFQFHESLHKVRIPVLAAWVAGAGRVLPVVGACPAGRIGGGFSPGPRSA